MLKNIHATIQRGLFVCLTFCAVDVWAHNEDNKKCQGQVECRLLDDDFDLSFLQSEFESIKDAIIPRSKSDTKLWHGIPLKNALGAIDAQGLNFSVSIKADKMEKCYPTQYLEKMPYIKLILEEIEKRFNTEVGLVRIFKLPPENALAEHTDGQIFDIYSGKVYRLHIPIITSPNVKFIINNKAFYLEPGKLYFTNVSLPHYVVNNGNNDRIHLIIDVFASDELQDFILRSEEPPFVVKKFKVEKVRSK